MQAISSLIDLSFDLQDLSFEKRIKHEAVFEKMMHKNG
jgi:hypothetical protein